MFELLTPATKTGFFMLYGILFLASIIVFILNHKLSDKTRAELKSRIKTWAIIITGLLVALAWHKSLTVFSFMVMSFLAFREYVKSINIREQDRHVVWFSYLMIPLQYFWIAINWYGMAIVFIPVYVFLSIPLFLILSKEPAGFLKSVGILYWGMMAAVFCLSHVPLLLALPENLSLHVTRYSYSLFNMTSLIFFVLFLTEFNDVLQYVWGKLLGKTKIIPSISPNKTCAGFLGGLASTILLSYIISPYLTPFTHCEAIAIGAIIGFAGFIGDVCMSAIKRDIGMKDYSSFLPGHGGVLDRLDSLIYTAPLFFHFIHYFYY